MTEMILIWKRVLHPSVSSSLQPQIVPSTNSHGLGTTSVSAFNKKKKQL